MTKVVDFPAAKPLEEDPDKNLIWICECGCSTHTLHCDGVIRCAVCETPFSEETSAWYSPVRSESNKYDKEDEPFNDIQGNGSRAFAIERMRQRLLEPGCTVAVLAFEDGSVSVWSTVESKDRVAWARRKLKQGFDIVKKIAEEFYET